jgi:hypothetical protein
LKTLQPIAFIQHEAYDETPMPLRAADKSTKRRSTQPASSDDRRKRTAGTQKLLQVDLAVSVLVRNVATGRLVIFVLPAIVTPVLVLDSTAAECIHEALQGRLRISALMQGLREHFPVVLDFSCCDSASANLRYEAYMAGKFSQGVGLTCKANQLCSSCRGKRNFEDNSAFNQLGACCRWRVLCDLCVW